jgi:hypothetical protein
VALLLPAGKDGVVAVRAGGRLERGGQDGTEQGGQQSINHQSGSRDWIDWIGEVLGLS